MKIISTISNKGVAMGFRISGLDAEIFLQFYENFVVLCTLAGSSILFCNRYVDHILLTFDEDSSRGTL